MPLRPSPLLLAARLQRQFHASAIQRSSSGKNYYEILQIPTTASPAEVKKYVFYYITLFYHHLRLRRQIFHSH